MVFGDVGPEDGSVGFIVKCVEEVGWISEGDIICSKLLVKCHLIMKKYLTGIEVQDLPERRLNHS